MSAKEFYLNVGDKKIEAFIYEGFLNAKTGVSPLHRHKYTEVHFTESGECRIVIGNDEFISSRGTVTVVPAGVSHRLSILSEGISHFAFFINYRVSEPMQSHVLPELLCELGGEIRAYEQAYDFSRIAPYLTFICKDVIKSETELREVDNREFLIHEFFIGGYNKDITLSDLASEMNLSVKQAARLVKKYTGMTFSKALARYRLNAAKQLMELSENLTLAEIAYAVGYKSYSGFWKAYRDSK